jgi:pilus assembly protein CpaB
MNRRNSIIALISSGLFGALAFFLLYQKSSDIERKTTPIQVLTAAHYIPTGSALTSNMVTPKWIPEGYVDASAIQTLKDVAGLITLVPISAGEQILSNKFGASTGSLAFVLEKGFRAYTLEVSETSSVGHLVHPGDHVDVLSRISIDKREVTAFVLQDILVIATGQHTFGAAAKATDAESTDSYNTVTLSLMPEQCETLMHIETQRLRLVLRPPTDHEIVSITPRAEADVVSRLISGAKQPKRAFENARTKDTDLP